LNYIARTCAIYTRCDETNPHPLMSRFSSSIISYPKKNKYVSRHVAELKIICVTRTRYHSSFRWSLD